MPSAVDIKQIVDTKPLAFTIKTGNGRWQCQIHKDRASYERARTVRIPGISRSDSGLSTSSTSSTSSKASQ
ncbi:uncharacterized protein F4807DRAFT_455755 [Annulohypoxylon truncatum]|uniref:uncharacterized protein n=1 Tax=Annulohypoxylon truncatum TaxID=327061 RepID=UPI002008A197|nr:uncharacterized protein F4807DRAFT_455755 [Annulohypoxylon truncatum]KAI1214112.1 hypothetical protein F4807DRAFT_455755 [Annulohypoxylon truncatum]